MAISLNRLGALILSINKIDLLKLGDKELVKGVHVNKLTYTLNIHNAKIFQIFQELLVVLTNRSTVAKELSFTGQEQPNFAPLGGGILTFDFTLKRFQTSENGLKYFDSFPREGCRVYNNAAFSVPDNTSTAVTFNTERFDPFSMHSTSASTSRITITRKGRYNIGGCVEFAADAAGYRGLGVRLNGTTTLVATNSISVGAGAATILNVSADYEFALNDYIELMAFQNTGGALNANSAGNYSPEFWACRIHDQPV